MLWHTFDVIHLHEELAELFDWQWLRVDLVHATTDGLLHILVLHMASDRHDPGLLCSRNIQSQEKLPDSFGCLIPIQEGHVAVHKNKRKSEWVLFVHRLLYRLYSLFSIVSEFCHFSPLSEPEDH